MARHNLVIGLFGENDTVAGAQGARCSELVLFENGKILDDTREQECPAKCGDVNQAAARTVRQTTKE